MSKRKSILLVIGVIAAVCIGLLILHSSSRSAASQPRACSTEPIYMRADEQPGGFLMRAAYTLRDESTLPSEPTVIENYGDAAQVFIHQFDSGIVPVAAQVKICATQTKILSVNGDHVD